MLFVKNGSSFEVFYEKTASPIKPFIKNLRVRVKEIAKSFGDGILGGMTEFGWRKNFQTCQVSKTWQVSTYSNQKMEVIWHQAIGISIYYLSEVLCILLQKKPIIIFLPEYILNSISMVKNMIGLAGFHLFALKITA